MIPAKESYVFYYSWYVWIVSLSAKNQLKVFKALAEYALYDIEIPQSSFTLNQYAVLLNFKHLIDANKRNYLNGKKGGPASHKVSRQRTSDIFQNLATVPPVKTPATPVVATSGHSEYDNDNDNAKGKVKKNESGDGNAASNARHTETAPPPTYTYEYIYNKLLPVFFFRNCNAKIEIKKFYNFYVLEKWHLSGGDILDTPDSLKRAASKWKVADTTPFFPPSFMSIWEELYELMPNGLKAAAMEISTSIKMQNGIQILCSEDLYRWLTSEENSRRIEWLIETKLTHPYKVTFGVRNKK